MMTNKTYDILVWVAQIVLPALGAFYAAIAQIWGLPYEAELPATILAVDTLLGALLKISTVRYNRDNEEKIDG